MQNLHVRLYVRPDCCLCDEATALLEKMRGDYEFWVEKINIDDDPMLRERLRQQIPVITIDGGNRIALHITEDRLRRAFKAAQRRHVDFPNAAPVLAPEAAGQ